MINRTTVQVFLASPMDLVNEREVVRRVVDDINGAGRRVGVTFEIVGWETDVAPSADDDAQAVVNTQIRAEYDVFVCLFRDRLGTPTKRSASGTVEEYERAVLRRESGIPVRIMAYFLKPTQPNPDVEELKARMGRDGVLYGEVEDASDLRATLYKDLNLLLLDYARMAAKATPTTAITGRRSAQVGIISPDGQLLLVRRSSQLKVGAGMWQVPGGKLDEGEKPIDAAIREIYEELGITLDRNRLEELSTFEDEDRGRPNSKLTIHLFSYRALAGEFDTIRLSDENQQYEWVSLREPLGMRTYLGINKRLVRVLWREENGIAALNHALRRLRESDGMSMCDTDHQDEKTMTVLGMMSTLGLIQPTSAWVTSPFAQKVMEAIVSLSRSDQPLFESRPGTWEGELALSATDHRILRESQQEALRSHSALLTALSARARLPHSVRDVIDVVVFGELDGRKYLLLRWDFFSKKYQLISSGLESVDTNDLDACARHTLERRVSPFAATLFSHVLMARFTTHHFSSGSVDSDPILRRYNVTVLRAEIRAGKDDDFIEALKTHNELNSIRMEMLPAEDISLFTDFDRFEWVPLDEILDSPTSYDGKRVQGVAEIIDSIGRDAFVRFSTAVVHVC